MNANSIKRGLCAAAMGLLMSACGGTDTAPDQDELVEDEALALERQMCGGIAGLPCSAGYACVDDHRDDCDPARGGADCAGICVKERGKDKSTCDYNDPSRQYVSQDPVECAAIRFMCAEGSVPFFDDCGCGCERLEGAF